MAAERPPADRDRRGSIRMHLAARMLRRGDEVSTVAATTGVPVPLLGLVHDELHHQQLRRAEDSGQEPGPDSSTAEPVAAAQGRRRRRPGTGRRDRPGRGSTPSLRTVIAILLIELAALVAIIACVIAIAGHHPGWATVTGGIAFALIVGVRLLSPPHRPPTRAGTHSPTPTAHPAPTTRDFTRPPEDGGD